MTTAFYIMLWLYLPSNILVLNTKVIQ